MAVADREISVVCQQFRSRFMAGLSRLNMRLPPLGIVAFQPALIALISAKKGIMAKRPGSAADPLWYQDAIIYELHVRAFKDSNADGIGDFQGLIQKLDYLQDLGVTCLWLLPFFSSPLKDDGYDISDLPECPPDVWHH
jgi:hypothetical protein